MNPGDGGLFLLRRWERPGLPIWLGLDLLGAEIIHEINDPQQPGSDLLDTLLLGPDFSLQRVQSGRTLLIPEGVLWAMIDPLGAGRQNREAAFERHAIETELRQERNRFQQCLPWWQKQGGAEGGVLRGLLGRFQPDLTVFLDLLDRAALNVGRIPDSSPAKFPAQVGVNEPLPELSAPAVQAWLSSTRGLGAVYGPGFGVRSEQADMGRRVTEALVDHHPLLVESGTGVGKTLAYPVPLLAAVRQDDVRAVIATHTRALQVQILEQDIPRLVDVLGDSRCELLMGRRNYLCLRQRRAFLSQPLEEVGQALEVASLRMWLRATRQGLREELVGHPFLGEVLTQLFDTPEPCIPGDCYEGSDCFVQGARRRARGADLLIVNHSLLMHDLKAEHTLLGEYQHLVVDEAHRMPQVALDTHGLSCGRWRLEEIGELLGGWGPAQGMPARAALLEIRLRQLGPEGTNAADAVAVFGRLAQELRPLFRKWWSDLALDLSGLLENVHGAQRRIRIRDKADTFQISRDTAGTLLEKMAEAAVAGSRFAGAAGSLEELPPAIEDDLGQIGHAIQLIGKLQEDIHFLVRDPDDRWVTWVESTQRAQPGVLGATLIESGELLREYWLGSGLQPVMTSATLAVGEDFTHMLRELGLTRRRPVAVTHTSASPFDYHKQVLVLTPKRFLAPDASGFGSQVGDVLAVLEQEIGRKTMGLFTSYRQLAQAGEVLREHGIQPPGADYNGGTKLFEQTPGSPAAPLMTAFRQAQRAMLLGTSSFWEGVDFPGQDLEILVVAKLPFLVPSDPWVQARCDLIAAQGDNPFTDFMVRDAVLRLKQGFGRLIRRPGDRGVVIILDTRLHTKNYGATFLASMPVIPRSFGDRQELVERISDFFASD